MIAGAGELVLMPGVDHLMHPAGDDLFDRLCEHLPAVFDQAAAGQDDTKRTS